MRIAALYDIHGNLPALDAVLRDVRQAAVDHIVVGGDVIPGPMPRECVDRLRQLEIATSFISGNGEREVLALLDGGEGGNVPAQFRGMMRWVGEQLGAERERWLRGWPATLRLTSEALGDVLFCHATPRDDSEIFLRSTPSAPLLPIFEGVGASLVVCGHTHMQFDRVIGRVRVINAGSVGMPFGDPGAYWLLLDVDAELRVTRYDLHRAAALVRGTDYPQREEFAVRYVLDPPTEPEMRAAFSRAEIRDSAQKPPDA